MTAIVGDITPNDNIPKEEKNRLESAAIDEMCHLLEGGIGGKIFKIIKSFFNQLKIILLD